MDEQTIRVRPATARGRALRALAFLLTAFAMGMLLVGICTRAAQADQAEATALAQEWAAVYPVDPGCMLRIIAPESEFISTARNPRSGAYGYLQFMAAETPAAWAESDDWILYRLEPWDVSPREQMRVGFELQASGEGVLHWGRDCRES